MIVLHYLFVSVKLMSQKTVTLKAILLNTTLHSLLACISYSCSFKKSFNEPSRTKQRLFLFILKLNQDNFIRVPVIQFNVTKSRNSLGFCKSYYRLSVQMTLCMPSERLFTDCMFFNAPSQYKVKLILINYWGLLPT